MKTLLSLLILGSLVACQPSGTSSREPASVSSESLRDREFRLRKFPLVNAGPDISVEDSDKNGTQLIQLQGTLINGRFPIASYRLYRNGVLFADGFDSSVFRTQQLVPVGSFEFKMEAIDTRGNVGSDSVLVTVRPAPKVINSAPLVNAGQDVTRTDADFNGTESVILAGSASDADNNITSYKIFRNGSQIASGISAGVFSQTLSFPVGTHTLVMEATDAGGLKGSDSMIVTVKAAPNTAPVVNAGIDVPLTDFDRNGSELYTLKGTASDAENNIRSYRVLLNGVQVATSLTATIKAPVGKSTVVIEASDAGGLKGSDSLIITVSVPNTPPIIVVPSNTAPVVRAGADISRTDTDNNGSEMITLSGTASDAENNISSYRVLRNGVQVATSLTASISVPVGSHTIVMEATDAGGLKGSDSMMVNVTAGSVTPPPAGAPPKANAGVDIRVINNDAVKEAGESTGVETLLVNGSATAGSNPIVSYAWKVNGVAVEKIQSPVILPAQKIHFIKGNNLLELEVTDSAGVKAVDSAIVEVVPGLNDTPYAGGGVIPGVLASSAGGARIIIDRDGDGFETVRMVGSANSKNPIVKYEWLVRGQVLASGSTPDVMTTSLKLPHGVNYVYLRVTDSLGNTTTDKAPVNITASYVEQKPRILSDPALLTNHLGTTSWFTGTNHWKDQSAFRFRCKASHLQYDDPIVFPGQPGKSHLHMFFGNTLANGNSTYESLRQTGNGTCDGGPLNRSAYWMPALMNENGKVVVPDHVTIYYKNQPGTNRIPRGLKMIFGYDHRYPDKKFVGWKCSNQSGKFSTIAEVNCGTDGDIMAEIHSQGCWDGKNLDSPDHRSHMAAGTYNGYGEPQCPATHPVVIPAFTMLVVWSHTGYAEYSKWRLTSDHTLPHDSKSAALPGGTSFHADWFGAWDDSVMDMWHDGCMDGFKNCSAGNLGNGKILKENPGFSFTVPESERLIDPPVKPIP